MWAFMMSWFTPTVLFCVLNLVIGTIFITSNLNKHQHQQFGEGHSPRLVRVPSLLERVRSFDFSLYRALDNHHHHHQHQQQQFGEGHSPQLVRVPSLLDRVSSFDFSLYRAQDYHHHQQQQQFGERDSPQLVRVPSLLNRVRSFDFPLYRSEQPEPSPPDTQHTNPAHHQTLDQHPSQQDPDHHVKRSKSDASGETPSSPPAKVTKSASEKSVFPKFEEVEVVDHELPETKEKGSDTASLKEDEAVDAKADDFINRFRQQLKMQRLDSLKRFKDMLSRGSGH
ncbi:pathogen-associated molecular patterns-induced protein A70 [Cornus florida]|uniref:pathogen-associated molecular patterns-induced protein A70 n=1 Tax=Cornus florida TaxID=4283 RepID=UPI002898F397|nr:pathogen-associated molecular patterns-induced protein A70 [Cornus florida]